MVDFSKATKFRVREAVINNGIRSCSFQSPCLIENLSSCFSFQPSNFVIIRPLVAAAACRVALQVQHPGFLVVSLLSFAHDSPEALKSALWLDFMF